METSITTVIITKNEAHNINRCIDSVLAFSTKVILIDSYSSDSTIYLARQYDRVEVYQRTFDNYINQKNYAHQFITTTHILSIDADEVVSDSLSRWLITNLKNLPDAIKVRRLNYIGDQPIFYGSWYPDIKLRIWKQTNGKWTGSTPHEWIDLIQNTQIHTLQEHIIHYAYPNIEAVWPKSIKYAQMASKQLSLRRNIMSLAISLIFSPIIKLIKGLIIKKGWRNGTIGIQLEWIIARETFMKYLYAIEHKVNLNKISR